MYIWEVLGKGSTLTSAAKHAKILKTTDFEKNARLLRSKKRKLDAKKPVKPISPTKN